MKNPRLEGEAIGGGNSLDEVLCLAQRLSDEWRGKRDFIPGMGVNIRPSVTKRDPSLTLCPIRTSGPSKYLKHQRQAFGEAPGGD